MRYFERIITKQQLITFESDMLKHLKNHCFQSYDVLSDPHSSYLHLKYGSKDTCVSLSSKLLEGSWSKAHVIELIGCLILLHQYCKDYLLDFKNVDFSPIAINYDLELHQYEWRYWPLYDFKNHMTLNQLVREVLWYTGEHQHLIPLTKETMTLSHLKHLLATIESDCAVSVRKNRPFSFFNRVVPAKEERSIPLEKFKTSYQKTQSMLVNRNAPEQSFPLQYEYTEVGRDEKCAIKLTAASVSRFHAVIHRMNNAYYVADTASTNGTYLNGNRITDKTLLVNGDILQLGDKEFIFIR